MTALFVLSGLLQLTMMLSGWKTRAAPSSSLQPFFPRGQSN